MSFYFTNDYLTILVHLILMSTIGELVPMCMRISLMRNCSDMQINFSTHGIGSFENNATKNLVYNNDIKLCSAVSGDPALSALLSFTSSHSNTSFPSLLRDFVASPASSSLDKSSLLFSMLTSLRASILATLRFEGTDLFHLAEG